jgi:hypothetical protein
MKWTKGEIKGWLAIKESNVEVSRAFLKLAEDTF